MSALRAAVAESTQHNEKADANSKEAAKTSEEATVDESLPENSDTKVEPIEAEEPTPSGDYTTLPSENPYMDQQPDMQPAMTT